MRLHGGDCVVSVVPRQAIVFFTVVHVRSQSLGYRLERRTTWVEPGLYGRPRLSESLLLVLIDRMSQGIPRRAALLFAVPPGTTVLRRSTAREITTLRALINRAASTLREIPTKRRKLKDAHGDSKEFSSSRCNLESGINNF